MSGGLDRLFHGVACGALVWLLLLLLLCAGRVGRGVRDGRWWRTGCAVAALLLLFLPVRGLPVWKWLFSFCPNPSLPLLGLLGGALWRRLGGVALFTAADWRVVIGFGAIAGTVLYLNALLLPVFDLYFWGWHHEYAVWALAVLTLPALAWGNRAGVLFLAALIAYELQILESHNAWDYLIDPFYWLLSLGLVTAQVAQRLRTAWRGRQRIPPSPPSGRTWEPAVAAVAVSAGLPLTAARPGAVAPSVALGRRALDTASRPRVVSAAEAQADFAPQVGD